MPSRLHIPIQGSAPPSSFQHSAGLRALVLRWIGAVDPGLATQIHEDTRPKPYTISPIWKTDSGFGFDLTILWDRLLEPVVVGMASSSPVIRLGTQEFRALPPHIVASTDWEELLVDPPDSPWMDFELVTPTAHHSPGPYRKSIVLPTPELYFGSWLGRWNLYCEEFPMPQEILEVVADRVAIGACTGGTRALSLERGRMFIGFQGSVRFQVLKPDTLDTDAMRALWALARLASYSGTGVETMRGMGQTRLG